MCPSLLEVGPRFQLVAAAVSAIEGAPSEVREDEEEWGRHLMKRQKEEMATREAASSMRPKRSAVVVA